MTSKVSIEEVKPRQWRWYVAGPMLMALMFIVLSISITIIALLSIDPNKTESCLAYLFSSWLVVALLTLSYLCFISPIHASNDERLSISGKPRGIMKRQTRRIFWLPWFVMVAGGLIGTFPFWNRFAGISYYVQEAPIFYQIGGWVFGSGLVVYLLLLPYAWWLGKRFERLFAKRGVCLGCGYDMRGNIEAEDCPECGAMNRIADVLGMGGEGNVELEGK